MRKPLTVSLKVQLRTVRLRTPPTVSLPMDMPWPCKNVQSTTVMSSQAAGGPGAGGPARNRVAGFQRDIVIADIEYAFCDENIFARTGIDGVGVGRISRSPNRDMVDYDVFTVGRDQMEAGRVLQRDSLN